METNFPSVSTIEFPDGSVYDGAVSVVVPSDSAHGELQPIPHGFGVLKYSENEHYTGTFVQGSMHGFGVYHYPCGSVYAGHWSNGSRYGRGSFTRRHGGEPVYASGGTWERDELTGFGIVLTPFTVYAGPLENGSYTHEGILFANGGKCAYIGAFKGGEFNGPGVMSVGSELHLGSFYAGHLYGVCARLEVSSEASGTFRAHIGAALAEGACWWFEPKIIAALCPFLPSANSNRLPPLHSFRAILDGHVRAVHLDIHPEGESAPGAAPSTALPAVAVDSFMTMLAQGTDAGTTRMPPSIVGAAAILTSYGAGRHGAFGPLVVAAIDQRKQIRHSHAPFATVIQKAWRRCSKRFKQERLEAARRAEEEKTRRTNAAITLQRFIRGMITRRRLRDEKLAALAAQNETVSPKYSAPVLSVPSSPSLRSVLPNEVDSSWPHPEFGSRYYSTTAMSPRSGDETGPVGTDPLLLESLRSLNIALLSFGGQPLLPPRRNAPAPGIDSLLVQATQLSSKIVDEEAEQRRVIEAVASKDFIAAVLSTAEHTADSLINKFGEYDYRAGNHFTSSVPGPQPPRVDVPPVELSYPGLDSDKDVRRGNPAYFLEEVRRTLEPSSSDSASYTNSSTRVVGIHNTMQSDTAASNDLPKRPKTTGSSRRGSLSHVSHSSNGAMRPSTQRRFSAFGSTIPSSARNSGHTPRQASANQNNPRKHDSQVPSSDGGRLEAQVPARLAQAFAAADAALQRTMSLRTSSHRPVLPQLDHSLAHLTPHAVALRSGHNNFPGSVDARDVSHSIRASNIQSSPYDYGEYRHRGITSGFVSDEAPYQLEHLDSTRVNLFRASVLQHRENAFDVSPSVAHTPSSAR